MYIYVCMHVYVCMYVYVYGLSTLRRGCLSDAVYYTFCFPITLFPS